MPTLEVTFEFLAYRYDTPPITDDEFLIPLAIAPGEVEAAWSWKEYYGGAGVRIVTARSEQPVEDAEFERWLAKVHERVVRFLTGRPVGAYARLRSAGLINLHLYAIVLYIGDFPIVDFPPEMYAACRESGLGFSSTWETPEERMHVWPGISASSSSQQSAPVLPSSGGLGGGGHMTRDEAICRANEVMAAHGLVDCGRGCLERGQFGERLHSADMFTGRTVNERVGDPHWWVYYEAVFIEDDGTLRPTGREQTSVCVDVLSGHAEAWSTL